MVKIERSYPAPESLEQEKTKSNGKYNLPDVVNQLINDSGNKCYLCEIDGLQDPQVEHLIPHKGNNLDLKFNWDNLFWSCGHCNRVKNSSKYDDGIIDCCKEDPETLMSFCCADGKVFIKTNMPDDSQVELTVELLNEVYNKTNTGMRIVECAVRVDKLFEEMNSFYKLLLQYQKMPNDLLLKRKIRIMLDRKSAFAAFKRQIIRDNSELYSELVQYLA